MNDKLCPYCGSSSLERRNTAYRSDVLLCSQCGEYQEANEIAVLREQVKVLRDALGWLDNEMACRDDEFGGCLFSRQDFEIVRNALKQTEPKDGE